jgi:hypothetical protein
VHPPAKTVASVLLGLFVGLATSACGNTCDRMCDAQADLLERCFSDWETSWQEQSYSGRDEFLDRCHAVWGDAVEDLDRDDPARTELLSECEGQLEVARSDGDCESLLSIEP